MRAEAPIADATAIRSTKSAGCAARRRARAARARRGPRTCFSDGHAFVDVWSTYLARVRQHPKLTPAEEARLVHRLRATGDRAAARALVTAHLALVVSIARGFRRLHPNLLELVQEGNLALIRAVHRYDPARRVTLAAYVASWVRTYIGRFVLANLAPVVETDISSMTAVIARNLHESVRGWAADIEEDDGADPSRRRRPRADRRRPDGRRERANRPSSSRRAKKRSC